MDEYKSLNKLLKRKGSSNKDSNGGMKKFIKSYVSKILLCGIIFVIALIAMKINPKYKTYIYENVYEKNFSFAKINNIYQQYFGGILPFDNIVPSETPVFSEKLVYSSSNLYKDGTVLVVEKEYLVPVLESGIVVFIGEKENYGKTVIIQQIDGVDVWYGNVSITDIEIYDYVEKGKLLGEVIDSSLYLVFQKDGKYLDYKDYI